MYKPKDNHLRKQKAANLDDVLAQYLAENIPKEAHKGLNLQRAWLRIASDQTQKHTDKVMFAKSGAKKNGEPTILVYVDSSSWAAELNMQKEYYRIRLEQELGQAIEEVKFLPSNTAALRKKL